MRIPCCGLFLIICTAGCGSNLDSPEQLTLFSIDGRDGPHNDVKYTEEKFHGFPVIGKVEITDAGRRQELVSALKDGMARQPELGPAACFWPRHGLRVVAKGKTVEFVICFECNQVDEFRGDQRRRKLINGDVQPTFDKPLKDFGVPLAPK